MKNCLKTAIFSMNSIKIWDFAPKKPACGLPWLKGGGYLWRPFARWKPKAGQPALDGGFLFVCIRQNGQMKASRCQNFNRGRSVGPRALTEMM
jgi:hypothetical protein